MLSKTQTQGKAKPALRCSANQLSSTEVAEILQDYRDPTVFVQRISKKHRVSAAVIATLVRQVGMSPRPRGRKPAAEPTAFQRKILVAARNQTLEAVGNRFGRTRQRVAQICGRWREYFPNGKRNLPLSRRAVIPSGPKMRAPLRSEIVCFRLASPEIAALKTSMKLAGLPTTVSVGAGARAVLIMTLIQNGNMEPKKELFTKRCRI